MVQSIQQKGHLAKIPVLVTGATGRLGRCLVDALLQEDATVSVLTRDPDKARAYWPKAAIDFRRGDLTGSDSLEPVLAGSEVVFHLASHSPPLETKDCYDQPAHWMVSAEGTYRLIDAVRTLGVSRLVYVSSVMAMGTGAGKACQPMHEGMPCRPDTLYGRAKREAECAVLALGAAMPAQVHACVLRLPMVYGMDGVGNIARLVAAVRARRFPPWPSQTNRRSAVHVADVVSALRLASTSPRAAGKVYLVTDGHAYSTRWLYEQACRALGRGVPDWTMPLWGLRVGAGFGDLLERLSGRAMPLSTVSLRKLTGDAWYSNDRIRSDLGFAPQHNLQDEIERLAQCHPREC